MSVFGSRHICGTNSRTPGQNLWQAIIGKEKDAGIGIPEYRTSELLAVLYDALTPEEVDCVDRGFGFNRPRQSQVEIGRDLNMERNKMSDCFEKIIQKLRAPRFRNRIAKLVPTVDEVVKLAGTAMRLTDENAELRRMNGDLNDEIEKLKDERLKLHGDIADMNKSFDDMNRRFSGLKRECDATRNQPSKELRERCTALQKAVKAAQVAQKDAEQKRDDMGKELEEALSKLREANQKLANANSQILFLSKQTEFSNERLKSLEDASRVFFNILQGETSGSSSNSRILPTSIEDLELSDAAMVALERIAIRDVGILCKTSAASFRRLGVSNAIIRELEERLGRHGLGLRVS